MHELKEVQVLAYDNKVAASDHVKRQDVPCVAALYLELARPVIRLYPFEELHFAVHACYELPLHIKFGCSCL